MFYYILTVKPAWIKWWTMNAYRSQQTLKLFFYVLYTKMHSNKYWNLKIKFSCFSFFLARDNIYIEWELSLVLVVSLLVEIWETSSPAAVIFRCCSKDRKSYRVHALGNKVPMIKVNWVTFLIYGQLVCLQDSTSRSMTISLTAWSFTTYQFSLFILHDTFCCGMKVNRT